MTASEQLIRDFFIALSSGDLDHVATYCTEDLEWEPMVRDIPGAGKWTGRDKVFGEFIGPVRGAFRAGDPKVEVAHIAISGDFAMAETRATGERADGKPYDNRYAWAFELRDGRIACIREYMDSLYIARFFDMDLS